jgi:hypothetical protein
LSGLALAAPRADKGAVQEAVAVGVPQANLFDYFAAFVSVVLGLAVADVACSLHGLLVARRRVRWSPLPLLSALTIFSLILAHFFRLWDRNADIETVVFYRLVLEAGYVVVLFLTAAASLPDEIPPEGLDLEDWYMGNRMYLVGLLQVWNLILFVTHLGPPPVALEEWRKIGMAVIALLLSTMLARSTRPWLHGLVFAALLLLIHLGFGGWRIGYR